VFVSNRNGRPQLWLIDVNGGEAQPLTHLANGAMQPQWSSDGKQILFVSRINEEERAVERKEGISNLPLPPEEAQMIAEKFKKLEAEKADPRVITRTIYRSGTEFFDDRQAHLYTITLASNEVRRITKGDIDYFGAHLMPNGQSIICAVKKNKNDDEPMDWNIIRVAVKDGKKTVLLGARGFFPSPTPSPDGKLIAYTDRTNERGLYGHAHLMVVNSNGKSSRHLPTKFGSDMYQISWSRDSKHLLVTAGKHGNLELYSVDAKSAKTSKILKGNRMVRAFSVANKADGLAYLVSTPEYPCDIFTSSSKGTQEKRLSQANKAFIKRKSVQPVEEMWYKSNDGTRIQGWVIKPPNFNSKKKYPLAVEVHGGPHVMWSSSETTMWHEWQLLASAGYVVFFSNPRGSDGYGYKFKDAIHNDWGTYPTQDIMSGVDALIARGYIDTKKICLTGGSYGGYMTAWLVGHVKHFCAAVSQRGVYDLLSFYGTTDVPRLIEWSFDTTPWDGPEKLWKASPIAYAKNIRTPLMILHSEKDYRAPMPSAEGMYMALKKLKRKTTFVRFPDEGHELSRSGQPNRLVSRLDHILGWFDEHTKPKKKVSRKAKKKK
jgi:dipeptidyl aminopeptidase/acylaminoacyl peptidase